MIIDISQKVVSVKQYCSYYKKDFSVVFWEMKVTVPSESTTQHPVASKMPEKE
jgi:hypothetical protein